ncbi:PDZ and LIM domain protein Zasp isoform X4 [Calliphora vicina]|uniref:PDZ and LIM domain protein Zasp isoform X4 n=1 Tax=Calliphora vicina TaxID=7373 RepID=UPI00325AFE3A
MAQPQMMQIKLSRFDAQPWGFRLQGGTDFAAPLLVQKVNGGSLAEQAGLMPGDAVIKINDVDVFNLRHKDAQDIVVRSGNNFVITVQRGGSTWRPHVTPTGQMPQPNSPYTQTVTKTSLAHKQQDSQHIGCGYNNAAKPFGNGVDGNVKSIVNKQYNSPVGIYSDESIAETLSAQAEVLAGGVLGVNFKKNEKEYQAEKSEVLKFLREEESGPSTPEPHSTSNYYWTRSHAIGHHKHDEHEDERIGTPLQQNTLAPAATHRPSLPTPKSTATTEPPKPAVAAIPEIPDPRLIVMPVCPALQTPEYKEEMEAAAKAAALGPDGQPRPLSASGHPPCAMCGVGIVGVFVRIKDRNLHVECFKCATCGTSLKNQGYYNFNNKLYCDIHAKLAAMQNPPSGTEGYVPIPMKPNTKLSATTISSALSAHGYNNGVSNGSSTPAPQEENMNDLPLPPPPSPTQLQQFEIYNNNNNNINNNNDSQQHTRTLSSLSSMSTGSNTTHSSTQSLSPTPYNYHHNNSIVQQQQQQQNQMTHYQPQSESTHSSLSLDLYGSTSPLHSRQASSSSSSLNYGCNNDNYGTLTTIAIPPPPPPPLPEDNNQDLYINTMKQQHNTNNRKLLMTKQNENDMNSYNKTNVSSLTPASPASGGVGGGASAAATSTPIVPTTQKVYNKFLKEYSNKLLTQGNINNNNSNINSNANTMKHSDNVSNIHTFINNGTPKPFIATPNSNSTPKQTQQQHNHYLQQQQQQQQTNHNNNNNNSNIINTSLPSVAAITATLNNQLKFDSCQVAPPLSTATTPSSSNLSIVDKSPFNNSQIINDNYNTTATTNEMSTTMATGPSGDKPFEYVTLTGNVIRSVVPPGKGNVNYKVNQGGYARPYGAAPPAAAPKSPVSYPPQQQQQQWNQPPPTQPKPAGGNAYATLPRSNVGQQGRKPQSMYNSYHNNYSSNYSTSTQYNKKYPSVVGSNRYSTMPSSLNTTSYNNYSNYYNNQGGMAPKGGAYGATSAPKRGRGILNKAVSPGVRVPLCNSCSTHIRGPFITALGKIWCPDHFHCVNGNCRRPLQDIGFVEEKGDLYCEYCFEKYLAPTCSKCAGKIKGDCLNAIGKHFHPECFACGHCGKLFGNTPFFLEDGMPYCEADWNELFTTKCFACGFPVEAGDRWVEALNHNYHSQCFNCTYCKQNLEGQSFYNKGGRPFCKNHAR